MDPHGSSPTRTAQEVFNSLATTEVAPLMRAHGWSRDRATFRLERHGNVGIVQLSKSPWSRREVVWFWIKAGVWSARLAGAVADLWRAAPSRPAADTCHWVLYYDDAMRAYDGDGPRLIDWQIERTATPDQITALGREVRERFERIVLPAIEAHLSDEAIVQSFLDGYVPPQGDAAEYALALIRELDRPDLLPIAERVFR